MDFYFGKNYETHSGNKEDASIADNKFFVTCLWFSTEQVSLL